MSSYPGSSRPAGTARCRSPGGSSSGRWRTRRGRCTRGRRAGSPRRVRSHRPRSPARRSSGHCGRSPALSTVPRGARGEAPRSFGRAVRAARGGRSVVGCVCGGVGVGGVCAVSYTHLTLPTICSV
eukprot:6225716-Prymnesium_polylepis.1